MWGIEMHAPGSAHYEIVIAGQLDPHWADWFDTLKVEDCPEGLTRLSGPLPDQAALRAVLDRILDLNIRLISVQRIPE